ncbi:MAG TPA: hypothetical protein VHV31_06435 [Nitrolancea sp.]|nr:hypothetical protein [Nitrolancea sp.]
MNRRLMALSLILLLGITLAACGQVAPSGSAPGSAGFAATGTPNGALDNGWCSIGAIGAPPIYSLSSATSATMTIMENAVAYAKSTLHALHPNVVDSELGMLAQNDPNGKVCIVQLDGDTFRLPPCPPDNTQPSYAHSCGTGTEARIGLRLTDYKVVEVMLYTIPGTPTVQLQITLPPNAKLSTRAEAIAAALGSTTRANNKLPHVASTDLILAGQESTLNNYAPDTPVWRISFDQGAFDFYCPPSVAERMSCVSPDITIWLDAITGMFYASMNSNSTPTP